MAAPNTAYYRNKTYALKAEKTVGIVNFCPIVFTTAYQNEQSFKDTFFVDFIKEVITENVAGNQVVGYLAEVYPGTFNASMRKDERISNLSILVGTSPATPDLKILVDPLITKALPETPHSELEGTAAQVNLRPAYYDDTTVVRLHWQNYLNGESAPSGSWSNYVEKTVIANLPTSVNFTRNEFPALPENEKWFMAEATNSEGTKYSGYTHFEIAPDYKVYDIRIESVYKYSDTEIALYISLASISAPAPAFDVALTISINNGATTATATILAGQWDVFAKVPFNNPGISSQMNAAVSGTGTAMQINSASTNFYYDATATGGDASLTSDASPYTTFYRHNGVWYTDTAYNVRANGTLVGYVNPPADTNIKWLATFTDGAMSATGTLPPL